MPRSLYIHDPTADGDVEPNPGPVPINEFLGALGVSFIAAADKTALARHSLDIRARSHTWPTAWQDPLFAHLPHPPSLDDQLAMLSAYELYANVLLSWSPQGIEWLPQAPSEVALLQEQLRLLKLQHSPPH